MKAFKPTAINPASVTFTGGTIDGVVIGGSTAAAGTFTAISVASSLEINTSDEIGFYGATPVAQQTGVAVSAAGIHAALVSLGLITA